MSLLKLSLLLVLSVSFHLGLARPSSSNEDDKFMTVATLREKIWRHCAVPSDLFLKGVIWQAALAESLVILDALFDVPHLPPALRAALGPAEASKLTIPFVLGASLMTIGGNFRAWSIRTLGPLYTFEQCLRKEHRLVTHGPYTVVRHPGYAGLLYALVGLGIVFGAPGSWVRASGVLRFAWCKVLLVCTGLIAAASFVTVVRRSADEDKYLAPMFGAEWESWANRVKYRLVPLIH